MVTAIFVIILMASVAILVFDMSGKMIKGTTVQFRTEQAALLARSYTEFAIMSVINYDRNSTGNCIEDINADVNSIVPDRNVSTTATVASGEGYRVETRIYYIGDGLPCSESRELIDSNNTARSGTKLTANSISYYKSVPGASDALAAIVVDVYVFYKDPDSNSGIELTYHRRTLQKI